MCDNWVWNLLCKVVGKSFNFMLFDNLKYLFQMCFQDPPEKYLSCYEDKIVRKNELKPLTIS